MKQIITGAIVVLVIMVIAIFAMRNPSVDTAKLEEVDGQTSDIEQSIIKSLSDFSEIRLDTTIFENPAFAVLQDYTKQVEQEDMQRVNPFAEIGADALINASDNDQTGDIPDLGVNGDMNLDTLDDLIQ